MENYAFQRGPITAPVQARNFVFAATTKQGFACGAKLELDDGRIFRYAQAGGSQIEKALMCHAAALVGNWLEEVQTAKGASIGDTVIPILITTGSTFVAGDWDEGWMVVQKGTGLGELYRIASHTVHATEPIVTIADPGGIRTAIATTAEISIIQSLWKKVIVHPVTTATAKACGVPLVAIASGSWGWLQTKGPCPMTVDTSDTVVIGEAVGLPGTNAVAGAVGLPTDSIGGNIWGEVMYVGAADETAIIYLDLE